ncbi:MAG TPA: DUF6790 family protein [Rhizomicrobium sp.]|nr:DUF6790 family protein [Rhizomicrobium sp.]HEX4533803.1 DUF6790 family protein [Rhizomicrobium sp.]
MYLISIILLLLVFPTASVWADHTYFNTAAPLLWLVGKWFVFWAAGVRLLLAGLRQFFQPRFTAQEIFKMQGEEAFPVVRELGMANFATGLVGMLSLARPDFTLPVAIAAGLFYGIAGVGHIAQHGKSTNENIAMVSDLLIFLVFVAYVAYVFLG